MKFAISLIACIQVSSTAMAAPIQIYYELGPSNALHVKDIFLHQYQIPEDLVSVKKIWSCEVLKEKGKLDLCIKKNGDLIVVSVDKGFINESLKIFNSP